MRKRFGRRGLATVEYVLLLALAVVVAMGVWRGFGGVVNHAATAFSADGVTVIMPEDR